MEVNTITIKMGNHLEIVIMYHYEIVAQGLKTRYYTVFYPRKNVNRTISSPSEEEAIKYAISNYYTL